MLLSRRFLCAAATVALLFSGCSTTSEDDEERDLGVKPRGDRVLGISISDRADGDFDAAFTEATTAGMELTSLSLAWDDLETAPGVYAPNPDFLSIANSFYGAAGTKLIIGINPIDTNNKRVPDHLDGLAWDDQQLIDAYKALLDWAIPRIGAVDVFALSIGNEIDGSLASTSEWESYSRFFEAVAAHARTVLPGLQLGTKVTAAGLAGGFSAQAMAINEHTDIVLTTYYPLNTNFTIKPPADVRNVFDDLVARYPSREIAFAEIGTPSTTLCGSSPELQAEFVEAAFEAWDTHSASVIALEFTWMHDISQAALDVYEQYYGVSDACFLEYLKSLGLKSPGGNDKPAWQSLEREASARGWGD